MTVNEALKLFEEKCPAFIAKECYEYDFIYVFHYLPKEYAKKRENVILPDAMVSVNKNTGEVKHFHPFDIPIKEYKSGIRVEF